MAKFFLSASLGVALALSSVSTGFAATTTGGLANALNGQPGVTDELLNAVSNVQVQCASGGSDACRAALAALQAAIPPGLSPDLVNEIGELTTTVSNSLPATGQTGAVPGAVPGGAAPADPAGGGNTPGNTVDGVGDPEASAGTPG